MKLQDQYPSLSFNQVALANTVLWRNSGEATARDTQVNQTRSCYQGTSSLIDERDRKTNNYTVINAYKRYKSVGRVGGLNF